MFVEKKRNWINAPCHTITYTSWKQWKEIEVFNSPLWVNTFFPYIWNIKEQDDVILLQILYTPLTGSYISIGSTVDIKACIITIRSTDEAEIQQWLTKQVWAHMV
jgi:hypothetical protein